MPKPHQVTIPYSVFAEFQHWLARPAIRPPIDPRLTLATMLASMIGHIRLFQTTRDESPNVLEWNIDSDAKARDLPREPANLIVEFEKLGSEIEKLSDFRSDSYIDLYLALSVDPSDESLSIDVTTEPVLEGEDLATLVNASPREASPRHQEFYGPLDDAYFTTSRAAELLGVHNSTVTRRIRNNELIGFQVFKNEFKIPRDQFKNGDVVDGIAEVLSLFESCFADGTTSVDHKAAWAFLASTVYPGDSAPRPIDRLLTISTDRPVSKVLEELALAKQSLDYGDQF